MDIVPHLMHAAANKKTTDMLPPAPSAHQLLLSDRLDELEPTHRGLHRFQPRHKACYNLQARMLIDYALELEKRNIRIKGSSLNLTYFV